MLVYVINKHGKPLMPCSAAKARRLLRDGKAKVVRREPFTIQLLYGSSGYRQPVTLGVDAGSVHIGLSASTVKNELYASDVQLRYDVVELLATRRELRHRRRGKKTRYRPNRFNFMGIMRWAFFNRLKEIYADIEVKNTYGYITKQKRIALELDKAHHIDAYCIAGNLDAEQLGYYWYQRQMRKHNRQIHKLKFLKETVISMFASSTAPNFLPASVIKS